MNGMFNRLQNGDAGLESMLNTEGLEKQAQKLATDQMKAVGNSSKQFLRERLGEGEADALVGIGAGLYPYAKPYIQHVKDNLGLTNVTDINNLRLSLFVSTEAGISEIRVAVTILSLSGGKVKLPKGDPGGEHE